MNGFWFVFFDEEKKAAELGKTFFDLKYIRL